MGTQDIKNIEERNTEGNGGEVQRRMELEQRQ